MKSWIIALIVLLGAASSQVNAAPPIPQKDGGPGEGGKPTPGPRPTWPSTPPASPKAPQPFDWGGGGHITLVEGTYMPNQITFQTDANLGSCTAGSWLTWEPKGTDTETKLANVDAVYTLLLAAKLSGEAVNLFGNNSGCQVLFVHLR